jgi:hypothetical protein
MLMWARAHVQPRGNTHTYTIYPSVPHPTTKPVEDPCRSPLELRGSHTRGPWTEVAARPRLQATPQCGGTG